MNPLRKILIGATLALCGACGSSDDIDQPQIDYSFSLEKQYPETIHTKERDLPYPAPADRTLPEPFAADRAAGAQEGG